MLLVLLMLASFQSFAAACATRCAAMSFSGAAGSMPGMEHCSGTMIAASGSDSGLGCIHAAQACTHEFCQADLPIANDHKPADQRDVLLHSSADACAGGAAVVARATFERNLRSPIENRNSLASHLVSPISNLRV